jgi:hypothetical protein
MRRTTTEMGRKHEEYIASVLGARRNRGSGNQWANQMDGRQNRYERDVAFAFDAKSTLGKSITITRAMWEKAVEQSHGERPMIPLRWYDTERLKVGLDLVVITVNDLLELQEERYEEG